MRRRQYGRMALALAAGAGAFLGLALGLAWNFWFSALLGAGLYFAVWFLTAPHPGTGAAYLENRPGGDELAGLLEGAGGGLAELARQAGAIAHGETRRRLLHLAETGRAMVDYLQENPEKIHSARRFLTYYIDAAGKMARQYVQLQNAGLDSEEARRFFARARQLAGRLDDAFTAQLSALTADERMDVQADMDVLDSLLQEGWQ